MVGLDLWNDTETRHAIEAFVAAVTDEGGPDYVEPAARIAVFDNDGTLWVEKPLVIQLDFALRRLAELAERDPSLRDRQPYRAAHENDHQWVAQAMVNHYRGAQVVQERDAKGHERFRPHLQRADHALLTSRLPATGTSCARSPQRCTESHRSG
jgi:hypothetical protein